MTEFVRLHLGQLLRVCAALLAMAFFVVGGIRSSFPALFLYPLAVLILIAIPLTLLVLVLQRRFRQEAALVQEKTQLLTEQKKRAAQLELASSIAAQLGDTQDPQAIMRQVVERIGQAFGYHVVGIMLVDEEARELEIRAAHGLLAERDGSPYRQSIDQGILGIVARSGKSYHAPDVTRDPYYIYAIPGDDPVRSELAVPLRQNGHVTGVLDLQSTEPNVFDASDIAAMEILAEQLAAALTRAAALAQQKKRAAHLALVSEIAARAMAMEEPQAMLQTMVQLVQERFGYHHVCVSLLDNSRDELELCAIAGPNASYYRVGERWKTDRGLIGMAARTRELVVSNDVKSDPRFVPDSDEGDANSELCIPLTRDQTVLGVLDVETTTRNGFSDDDMTALATLANQIAAALDKAHALARERRRAAQLELVNRIASRIARLSPIDQLLPDLVKMVHEQFGYINVAVFLQQPNTIGLTLFANAGPLASIDRNQMIIDKGIIGHVRKTGQLYLCQNADHDPFYHSPYPQREADPTRSELALPLRRGETLSGVLDIQSEVVNAFDASDITALQVLADQISETLENARLLEQLQARLRVQQTLTDVSRTFLEALDSEPVARECTRAARAALNVDCAIIFMPNDADRLMIRYSNGFPEEPVTLGVPADSTSIPGRAFVTRRAQIWNDSNADQAHSLARKAGFRAGLSVPMLVGERVVGVVTVNTFTPRRFDETDVQTLSLVANQTAIALERATYFQKQQRSTRELNLLFDAYRAASSTLEPGEVIARLLEQLTRALDVTSADFIQVDQSRLAWKRVSESLAEGAKRPEHVNAERTGNLGDLASLMEQLRNGPAEFHRADPDLSLAMRRAFEQRDGESSLHVPLWSQDELLGYFSLWESRHPRHWSADEIRFIETLASQAAAALANARLYASAATRARELQTLNEASRLLNQSLDVRSICQTSVDSLYTILGYSHVSIYFVQGDVLKLQVERGYANVLDNIPLDQGVMGRAVRTRQIAFLPHVSEEPRFLAAIPGIESEIAVPLLHGEHALGVLNVETIRNDSGTSPDHLTQADVQLLSTFANQLVVAIENGRMYEQSKQDAEVKAALLRELSHRVKNNLAAITSLLYLALDELPEARDKILSETLGRVQSMALAHALLARSERAKVNLLELGRQVLMDTVRQLGVPGTPIEIVVQGAPVEVAARQTTTLALVLNELATNSLRHGFEAGMRAQQGVIRFSVWHDDETVCLELEDNGQGLPPDFDLEAATGLGLNLVRTLVEKDLHGKFDMQCERQATRTQIRFRLED